MTLAEYLALQPPEQKYVIEPQVLARGGSMFVYGKAETLKSWIVLDLAFSVASGRPWLGVYPTHQGKVLVVQVEQTEFMYHERLLAYHQGLNGSKPKGDSVIFASEVGIKLDNFYGLAQLESILKAYEPQVCVLDNMYRVIMGSDSDEPKVKAMLDGFAKFQQDYQCAFVIVSHTRKEKEDGDAGLDELRGSAVTGYWADTVLRVRAEGFTAGGRPEVVGLEWQKLKLAREEVPSIRVRFDRKTVQLKLH